jgi:xylulokinase
MTTKYLIGVDLGTSATKAALYRPDGTLVAEASAEVPIYYPKPGVVEQENDDFYCTAAQTVSQCMQSSGVDPQDVAAIAFDSQMAGIGSVNEDFKPATRFDSWLDMRCQPYIDYLNQNYGDLVTHLTGCPPTCNGGSKILWWKGEQPESYDRIAKFLTPSAYVAGTMAGLKGDQAFMDHTFLHFSALADAQAGEWSTELMDKLDVDPDKLPRIVPPWEVIGEVTPQAAKEFNLVPGTPIAAGCGDTAAGALGAGIVRPSMIFDTAGTASVLAGCTDQFVSDGNNRALLTMHSVIPDLWHPLAYIAGGGIALRWFRDEFFNKDKAQLADDDLYSLMTSQAAEVAPGAEGLFFSPHLGGRICPAEPTMRGTWVGFSWGHTRAHFFRAVLEGIAFEYAYYLSILKDLNPDLNLIEARVIGGGARSPVWNQIKADVLGVPFQRLQRSEFATWGGALIAGYAVGLFDDLADAATATTRTRGEPVPPRPDVTETYQDLVKQYISWQETLADKFRVLSENN